MLSLKQIQKDHSLISSLAEDEIQKILTKNKGRHFPVVRKLLKQRLNAIKSDDKVESLILNIEAIFHRVANVYEQPNTHTIAIRHARSIANDIHDLPAVFSGNESARSLAARKKNPSYVPCKDHFYPRLWSGLQIVDQIYLYRENFKPSLLAEMLYNFCHVNYVTDEENNHLRQFQTVDSFTTPNKTYKKANIKLQKVQEYMGNKTFESAIKILKQKETKHK